MDKKKIIAALLLQLQSNLDILITSANTAKEAATSEESKAENKYDTRRLEASYLAGAQARRSEELKTTITKLNLLNLRQTSQDGRVEMTSVVKVGINDLEEKNFFILPMAGGFNVIVDGMEFHIITPETPVGLLLLDKQVHDTFEVKIKNKNLEYEIREVY